MYRVFNSSIQYIIQYTTCILNNLLSVYPQYTMYCDDRIPQYTVYSISIYSILYRVITPSIQFIILYTVSVYTVYCNERIPQYTVYSISVYNILYRVFTPSKQYILQYTTFIQFIQYTVLSVHYIIHFTTLLPVFNISV